MSEIKDSTLGREDIFYSLEQFCNSKNLPVAKYRNLLKSTSGNVTPSISRSNSSTYTGNTPSPVPLLLSNSNSVTMPSPNISVASNSSLLSQMADSPTGSINITTANLGNFRFSLSGNGNNSLQNTSLGKRSNSDEEEGSNKRSKKSVLTIKLKVGITFQESKSGGVKKVEYPCYIACAKCTEKKETDKSCDSCGGTGRLLVRQIYEVDVPKGAKRGSKKIFKDKGHFGEDLKHQGDLIIEFEVEDHPFYKRVGDNATCLVNISVVQAVLGTKIYVPKLYSEEKLTITLEPGIQSNELLKISNEGFFKINCKKKRGDLEVSIKIDIPHQLTKEQKELYEKIISDRKNDAIFFFCGHCK